MVCIEKEHKQRELFMLKELLKNIRNKSLLIIQDRRVDCNVLMRRMTLLLNYQEGGLGWKS